MWWQHQMHAALIQQVSINILRSKLLCICIEFLGIFNLNSSILWQTCNITRQEYWYQLVFSWGIHQIVSWFWLYCSSFAICMSYLWLVCMCSEWHNVPSFGITDNDPEMGSTWIIMLFFHNINYMYKSSPSLGRSGLEDAFVVWFFFISLNLTSAFPQA